MNEQRKNNAATAAGWIVLGIILVFCVGLVWLGFQLGQMSQPTEIRTTSTYAGLTAYQSRKNPTSVIQSLPQMKTWSCNLEALANLSGEYQLTPTTDGSGYWVDTTTSTIQPWPNTLGFIWVGVNRSYRTPDGYLDLFQAERVSTIGNQTPESKGYSDCTLIQP